jgi:hypothetical protein
MLCGLLLGLLLMLPMQAQAQFGFGIVFDPKAYALDIERRLEDANRFLRTVQHYQETFTNLKGILQTVDRQLAKNMETAQLTADIAQVIRGAYLLQNQVRNMVKYQIAALQQIDDRLKNGIFDPDKDLADLEEYLIYSMGRNSRETIRIAVQTALADAQVSKWMTERRMLAIKIAEAYQKLKAFQNRLEKERKNPDPFVIQPLNESIQRTQIEINNLEKSLAELEEKIQQRINAHGLRLSDMENFGYTIESTRIAWEELQKSKDQIDKTFNAAVLQMRPE